MIELFQLFIFPPLAYWHSHYIAICVRINSTSTYDTPLGIQPNVMLCAAWAHLNNLSWLFALSYSAMNDQHPADRTTKTYLKQSTKCRAPEQCCRQRTDRIDFNCLLLRVSSHFKWHQCYVSNELAWPILFWLIQRSFWTSAVLFFVQHLLLADIIIIL